MSNNENEINESVQQTEEDINALKAVRLGKLNELVSAGSDPFAITN